MEQIKLGLRIASIVVGIIGYSAIWMWLINNRRNEKVNLRGYYGNTFMQLRLRLRFFGLGFRRIRMLDDKCCGTCKYHHHENIDDGWVCVNDRSEYCADWTECSDSCGKWEVRE